jgi:ubiquinone/menaquinone biosynthesis C-methylase UbiE
MNWLELWNENTGGQLGHLPHVVSNVKEKLELGSEYSIIDVGCGSGSLLEKLPAKIKVGIDPSHALQKQASERGINVIDGVSWKLLFEDNTFDRVLLYSVTHYLTIKQTEESLKELTRVCKPGGLILIGDIADVKHYRFYSFYTLREMLFNIFNITHAIYFKKKWFEERGFTISDSANSNKRFDALKRKI